MIIKLIYTLFLAILVALFVGLGISAFYPAPKAPEYPIALEMQDLQKAECNVTAETKTLREENIKAQKTYEEEFKYYNRNVSIISLIAAIIILVLSLTLLAKINMIADGILLGGVFAAGYSIIRGFMSENTQFRFIIVVIGLAIALTLGYIKFIRPKANPQQN